MGQRRRQNASERGMRPTEVVNLGGTLWAEIGETDLNSGRARKTHTRGGFSPLEGKVVTRLKGGSFSKLGSETESKKGR